MVYRICGGIGLLLLGLSMVGVAVPEMKISIFLIIGGIALLAGI